MKDFDFCVVERSERGSQKISEEMSSCSFHTDLVRGNMKITNMQTTSELFISKKKEKKLFACLFLGNKHLLKDTMLLCFLLSVVKLAVQACLTAFAKMQMSLDYDILMFLLSPSSLVNLKVGTFSGDLLVLVCSSIPRHSAHP